MEQRPAPCCRVSSYCTDPVYTGDDDYHETAIDLDVVVVVSSSSSSSLSMRFDSPSFPPGFSPFFPALEDFGAPSRTTWGCQHPLFRCRLISFIYSFIVGLLIKLYAGRCRTLTKSRSCDILNSVVNEITFFV